MIAFACAIAFGIACGSSGTTTKTPDAAIDAFFSICGNPGDTGNEKGIGKFCTSVGDCADTVGAPLCANLGNPDAHFCTTTCPSSEMGSNSPTCGTGISCTCNSSNQCGCTPNSCLGP
jgi:hypothetical protein